MGGGASRGCWNPSAVPALSSHISHECLTAQGQVILSKRGVSAFSAALGMEPITSSLILLQRQSCRRRKGGRMMDVDPESKEEGGKGGANSNQIFPFSKHQRPLVPGRPTAAHLGRGGERWYVASRGEKANGCLGPSPDPSFPRAAWNGHYRATSCGTTSH